MQFKITLSLLCLLFSSFALADSSSTELGRLPADFKLCTDGKEQSPIDITNVTKTDGDRIKYTYANMFLDLKMDAQHLYENIHSHSPEYLTFKSQKYYLESFHFHEPSEHTINGHYYPMEMHFVHKDEQGKLLVIGVFVKEGKENKNLDQFFAKPLSHKGHKDIFASIKINPANFISRKSSYYVYPGSLTTPPCTEGVTWVVMTTPIEASKRQLKLFETHIARDNARDIQPLNNRQVMEHIVKQNN